MIVNVLPNKALERTRRRLVHHLDLKHVRSNSCARVALRAYVCTIGPTSLGGPAVQPLGGLPRAPNSSRHCPSHSASRTSPLVAVDASRRRGFASRCGLELVLRDP